MSSRRKQFKPKSAIDIVDADDISDSKQITDLSFNNKSSSIISSGQHLSKSDEINERKRKRSISDADADEDDDESIESNGNSGEPLDHDQDQINNMLINNTNGYDDDNNNNNVVNNNDTMNDIDDFDEMSECYERLNKTTILTSAANYDESFDQSEYTQLNQSVMLLMFKCKVCGKGFKHRRSLNRHVKLHSGEKNFKCPFCATAFARSDHLKAHIRTHNNSKPYRCSICQCGYSTQAALKVHIAHHHSKSKFRCVLCNDLEFHSQLALEGHMYTNHSKENETADLNELINETATLNPTLVSIDESNTQNVTANLTSSTTNTTTNNYNNNINNNLNYNCNRTKLIDINNLIKKEEMLDYEFKHEIPPMSINMTISPNKSSSTTTTATTTTTRPLIRKLESTGLSQISSQAINAYPALKQIIMKKTTNCNMCNVTFSNLDSYLAHMRTCHNIKTNLNTNNTTRINTNSNLNIDNDIDNNIDKKIDNSINIDNNDNDNFNQNENDDFNYYTKDVQYKCAQCINSNDNCVGLFSKLDDYLQHIKQEHCVEVYRCVLCKQMQLFDNLNLLKEHFFNVHQSSQSQIYKCKLCSYTSIEIDDLNSHLKLEHNRIINPNQHLNAINTTNYSCQYCRQTFNNKTQLERHVRIHLSTVDLKCNICDRQFENKIQLNQHKQTHSLINNINNNNNNNTNNNSNSHLKQLTCSYCVQPIENESHFKEHFKRHNNIGQPNQQPAVQNGKMSYSCIVCRQQLTSNNEYLTHMKNHLSSIKKTDTDSLITPCQTNVCPLSPATTASSASSSSSSSSSSSCSSSSHKNDVFLCEICSSKFDSNFKLQTHLLYKHEYGNLSDATYSCPVCDETFNRADLLLQHTQIHGHAAKIYKCSQCSVAFVFKSQLINHSFSHYNQTKNLTLSKSPISNYNTTSQNSNNNHVHNQHQKQANNLQLKTSLLHEQLNQSPSLLVKREQTNYNNSPSLNASLSNQNHYVVNTNANGSKSFTCLTCSKTFANQRNLNVHMRIHTGFRPFECDICNRKFTRRENLRSHMKCHLNLRPFTCSICNRSFRRKSHVSSHIEVHFKSKIHNCIECEQQFDQLDLFLSHLIGQHNIYDKELLLLIKSKQLLDLDQFENLDYEYVISQTSGSPASMSLSSKPCAQQSVAHNAIPPLQHYQNLKIEQLMASQAYAAEEDSTNVADDENEDAYNDEDENGLVIHDDDDQSLVQNVNSDVNIMNNDQDYVSEQASDLDANQQQFDADENDDDYDFDQSIDYTD